MNFHIMTLFPEMVMDGLNTSITGRACKQGLINIEAVNIRDFTDEKHGHVDDYPYGGGAGMVMQPMPIYKCYNHIVEKIGNPDKKPKVVYMTPQGRTFNQEIAKEYSTEDDLIILCGHYEGVDERILEMIVDDNISIGDFVLTGGELPAMVVVDAISRLVPGFFKLNIFIFISSFCSGVLLHNAKTTAESLHTYHRSVLLRMG